MRVLRTASITGVQRLGPDAAQTNPQTAPDAVPAPVADRFADPRAFVDAFGLRA